MNKLKCFMVSFLLMTMVILNPIKVVGQAVNNEINKITKEEDKKIQEFIDEQMKDGDIPGLSIVIVQEDETVYQKGFGYADVKKKEEVTPDSLFEIGSNSKAFTAFGILKLQEEGLLELDDSINKYIPWLDLYFDNKKVDVTLEQFMYHTSGIPYSTIYDIPISDSNEALENTVENLKGIELETEPGTNFNYATINYDVLGLVIEKVTGIRYQEYIKRNVLKPLELNNTYLYREEAKEKLTQGYKHNFFKSTQYDAPEYRGNTPAGYIISSTIDMAKWMKIQLGVVGRDQVTKNVVNKSHEISEEREFFNNKSIYAGGWMIDQYSDQIIYHGGNNPNYSSFIILDPNKNMGITVLGNVNSQYIQNIAWGIKDILKNETPKSKVNDFNKTTDLYASVLIIVMAILFVAMAGLVVKTIIEIIQKKRKKNKITKKGILAFVISVVFMSFVYYCIYLIPRAFMGISNWRFMLVWSPITVKIAALSIVLDLSVLYLVFLLRGIYRKSNDKSLLELVVLSIVSGFGNSLIILSINLALGNKVNILNIGVYFILGIVLYVYGQRLVRVNLIKYINDMVYNKRVDITNKILKAPFDEYEKIEDGRVHAILNNDTERVSNIGNVVVNGVTGIVTLLFCCLYLAIISWQGLLLSVSIILIIATIYFLVGRYANKIWEEARDVQNAFFRFINDLTAGFKELTLNIGKKNEFEEDMNSTCNDYKIKRSKANLAFANLFVVGELLFTLAIGGVVFIFPLIIKNIDSGTLGTYVFILLFMTGPVHGVLNAIPEAVQINISLKRINKFLEEIKTIDGHEIHEKNLNIHDRVDLRLNDLEFEYENDEEEESNFKVGPINFEFKAGEITFVTGGNGSGKSTLAKLITGLYKPTKGSITLNNSSLKNEVISQHYSAIFSDFHLFKSLYGIDCEKEKGRIKEYLKKLGMDEKVKIENNQFSTINLSTGQRKRLALLITYLEDRPIYLFDEWAADQDPEFRRFFYRELLPDLKQRGKCVIAITHDDNYFDACDSSIKMEMGELLLS
ncbi:cyclic peptide export ABC transporter [Oceanirhabdus sp. W0125-5]|uniref:cyclic peptide export ABC transporter n=1 Tax=Oceanirhabdus sp. W0125-5 TaxID=2999116 RepID=UPI0022F33899|nr:cyclic peptide export ABC transporter [Oceanirhabdus sp. W0125-5]WBW96385.1 cyclic peptide export ABC transporter [Oceanirhabdus sp. W0125-5]